MHIVIISHFYPPLNAIASLRPKSFAMHFANRGVKVTVITTRKFADDGNLDILQAEHPNIRVAELDYTPLFFWKKRKYQNSAASAEKPVAPVKPGVLKQWLKNTIDQMGFLIDHQKFWTRKVVEKMDELVLKEKPDIIISTFSPPAVHLAAARVVKKYPQIKWIADYRDLWSLNHILSGKGVFKYCERWMEKHAIRYASCLTTVSDILAADLRLIGPPGVPVEVIYNGYEVIPQLPEKSQPDGNSTVQIAYTGTIYKGRRDPSPLFKALNELRAEGVIKTGDIKVLFYGSAYANLLDIIEENQAEDWAEIKGHLPYHEILNRQAESDILLFLESNQVDARGVLTGKLFEYLMSGTPIMAIGVDEFCATSQLINETKTGKVFGNQVQDIKKYLSAFIVNKCQKDFNPDWEKIRQYSREAQALKLLEIAKGLMVN